MLRVISERSLEIDEKLCLCFVDLQKALGSVKRTKLIRILKQTVSTSAKED